jgi:chaperone protein EcpD
MRFHFLCKLIACVCCWQCFSPAFASVVLSGTRVIFPSNEKEVTIQLSHEGATPSLVQVWLDHGKRDEALGNVKVPFVLMPALFRLDPGKGQTLRILATQEALPEDRESVFWLNVLEVPPKNSASNQNDNSNLIQMAFRTRIKLFYRPAALHSEAALAKAYGQIKWSFTPEKKGQAARLEASNPTPYYMTVTKVHCGDQPHAIQVPQGGMIAPFEQQPFPLAQRTWMPIGVQQCQFSVLNDYGSEVSLAADLS